MNKTSKEKTMKTRVLKLAAVMIAVAAVFAGCETVSGILNRGTSQSSAIDLSSVFTRTSDFLKAGEARWYKFTASTKIQYIDLVPGTSIEIHDSWGRKYSRPSRIQIVSGSVYYVKVWQAEGRSDKGVSIQLKGSPSSSSVALEPGGTPPYRSPAPATPSAPALAADRDAPEPSPAASPPPDITTEHWDVHDLATWIEAVGGIRSGGNNKAHIVTIRGDISVPITPASENTFGGVTNVTVTLENSGSLSPSSTNGNLLRIGEGQTVVVKDITLRGRDNNEGSMVITSGNFVMEGGAVVSGNKKKSGSGGGVRVDGGTFTMRDNAAVSGNSVGYCGFQEGGGGVCINAGIFVMQDNATVFGNTASGYGDAWGAVFVRTGTFTMKDNASVKNNTDSGVFVNGGVLVMQDKASVKDNTGRGVYIAIDVHGGQGTATMQDNAAVSGNAGGGVYVYGGVNEASFTMQGNALVRGNSSAKGAGVYVGSSGTFTMSGGEISENTASSVSSSYGGGVYVDYRGTFIMLENTTISGNSAISRGGGNAGGRANLRAYGGGVYVEAGVFTMKGGIISGNAANAVTSRNADDAASYGGGVCVGIGRGRGFTGTFALEGGTVSNNTAGNDGGGVYVEGTFAMQDGIISANTAGRYGGGACVDGPFTKTGGTIYGGGEANDVKNTAAQGLAVYKKSGPQWRNVTAGPSLKADAYGFWLND
jgi:predicted outer membrane repeat protein